MLLHFAYLQSERAPPRPVIPIRIVAAGAETHRDGLLDTGADRTILPPGIAAKLGIMPAQLPRRIVMASATDTGVECGLATVVLELRHERYRLAWEAEVAFALTGVTRVHWGRRGFLEFFEARFNGPKQVVTLRPTAKLPRVRL